MEWLLKYEAEVGPYAQYVASIPYDRSGTQPDGSWIVEESIDIHDTDDDVESQSEESYEWDSDNDDTSTVNHLEGQESLPYDHNARQTDGSWTVEEDKTSMQESCEWDSDNDDTFTVNRLEGQEYCYQGLDIIGFHPFKKVVFMARWFGVVAYHLNSSKIQYLGFSRPKCYYGNHTNGIYESFLYTPWPRSLGGI